MREPYNHCCAVDEALGCRGEADFEVACSALEDVSFFFAYVSDRERDSWVACGAFDELPLVTYYLSHSIMLGINQKADLCSLCTM